MSDVSRSLVCRDSIDGSKLVQTFEEVKSRPKRHTTSTTRIVIDRDESGDTPVLSLTDIVITDTIFDGRIGCSSSKTVTWSAETADKVIVASNAEYRDTNGNFLSATSTYDKDVKIASFDPVAVVAILKAKSEAYSFVSNEAAIAFLKAYLPAEFGM